MANNTKNGTITNVNYYDDDPTKRIRATAQFAEEMVEWLHNFSNRILELRAMNIAKLFKPACYLHDLRRGPSNLHDMQVLLRA